MHRHENGWIEKYGVFVNRAAACPIRFDQHGHHRFGDGSSRSYTHDGATIAENEDIKEFYLGLSGVGQRKSYRDVKHYKRRKRWLA